MWSGSRRAERGDLLVAAAGRGGEPVGGLEGGEGDRWRAEAERLVFDEAGQGKEELLVAGSQ